MTIEVKAGDRVELRNDLKDGRAYGDILYIDRMGDLKELIVRETFIDDGGNKFFNVLGSNLLYSNEMVKSKPDHREFVTGAVRNLADGKPRTGLLPWHLFPRLAKHYTNGADKHGDNNWMLGQPKDTTFDSLTRHLIAYRCGETDEDHLSAVIWNAFSLMHIDEQFPNNPDLQTLAPVTGTWAELYDFLEKWKKDHGK